MNQPATKVDITDLVRGMEAHEEFDQRRFEAVTIRNNELITNMREGFEGMQDTLKPIKIKVDDLWDEYNQRIGQSHARNKDRTWLRDTVNIAISVVIAVATIMLVRR